MVCIGEGEEALVRLCDKMDHGKDYREVDSIWVKDNGNIIRNTIRPLNDNLESRPFPDRSSF
jgi:anaerobic magnesium-protoporphyrin IX monomethyl ester cyclase